MDHLVSGRIGQIHLLALVNNVLCESLFLKSVRKLAPQVHVVCLEELIVNTLILAQLQGLLTGDGTGAPRRIRVHHHP